MATLTFVYAESTAVIGPLSTNPEPHAWDLCADHAATITVPRAEMLRSERGFGAPPEDLELTALAEAVRELGAAVGAMPLDGFDDLPIDRLPRAVRPASTTRHPLSWIAPRSNHVRVAGAFLCVLPDPDPLAPCASPTR